MVNVKRYAAGPISTPYGKFMLYEFKLRDISNMISFTSNKTTTVIKRPDRSAKAAKASKPAGKAHAAKKMAQAKPKPKLKARPKPKMAKPMAKKPQHKNAQKKRKR